MRNRNNPEVHVAIGDPHRLANVLAICQELFAAKTDCPRCTGGARSELQEYRRIFAPGNCSCRCPQLQNLDSTAAGNGGSYNNSGYLTYLKRTRSLLVADRLFQR